MSFGIGPHDPGCPCARCESRRPMRCKFCGCTEDNPCFAVPGYREENGEILATHLLPCAWLIPNVCTNPACVDQAYAAAKLIVSTALFEVVA